MSLRQADLDAYRKVARTHLPAPADRLVRDVSAVAGHSVLWAGLAAGMGLSGRMSLRRAGLRGLVAIGIASPLANVVAKQLAGRSRPSNQPVPLRRRASMPASPSFPSGHAASAAAFATGVALEAPLALAVPTGLLAGLVGFSRVYVGVHYPGDVLAGAAMGVCAGLATRLLWEVPPRHVDVGEVRPATVDPRGKGVVVVINAAAGKGAPPHMIAVAELVRHLLPDAEVIQAATDDDLARTLDDAARRADILAVAGGDGTVGAGASAALRHRRPLLVIPAGTLNHFARALGLETPNDALHAYRHGHLASVDVGLVNDQPFVNTASFGIYTELVAERDKLESRLGKWPALAVAATRVLRHAEPVRVTINNKPRDVWLAFFGNCRYLSKGPAPTWRRGLDDGLLDVRLVLARKRLRRSRGVAGVLTSGLRFTPDYRRRLRSSVTIRPGHFELAHDGECTPVDGGLAIAKRPRALEVFVASRHHDDRAASVTGQVAGNRASDLVPESGRGSHH